MQRLCKFDTGGNSVKCLLVNDEEIGDMKDINSRVKTHLSALFRPEHEFTLVRDETHLVRDLFCAEDIEQAIKACNF